MKAKKIILIIFYILFFFDTSHLDEIKIVAKIDNEIITNIDIEKQTDYLLIINKNLKSLSKNELISLAKSSLIKEEIKRKEIEKSFKIKNNSTFGEEIIKEHYLAKGFGNKQEFSNYLKKSNLEFENFKKKLVLERLWSTLIYEKYQNKIKYDEIEIRKKIKQFHDNQEKKYKINLSEIIYNDSVSSQDLLNFIKKHGFESTAIKYSLSDTSQKGGEIGWINLNNLNEEIKKSIIKLNIGDITRPIKISSGNLILKINAKKEIKNQINLDEEVKKHIIYERNRQLKIYSMNHYNKLKQNITINEY